MKYPLYQDSLCPKLWANGKLDSEAQKGLLDIAKDFVNDLRDDHDLPVEILDVVIIGSVANYNWTPYSDVDLHIITDFSKLDMPAEQAQIMFDALKGNWNNKHNITVKGHDVELYVQDKDYEPSSAAEYSILKGKWLKEPKKETPQFDKALIKKKYVEYKKKIDALADSGDEDGLRKLLDKLYKYRQAGLDKGGELSDENIIFKALRAKGYLDKIKDTVTKLYDKKMTIKESDVIEDGISSMDGKHIEYMRDADEGEFALVPTDDDNQRRLFSVYDIPVWAAYRVMPKAVAAMHNTGDEDSMQMAKQLVNIRTAIKHPEHGGGSKSVVNELVNISVERFLNDKNFDARSFDVVIPLGSKSKLNNLVAKKLKKQLPNIVVLDDFLEKDVWKNVQFSDVWHKTVERLKREGKPLDWYENFAKAIEKKKRDHANELFGIKNVPPTTRRYFSMFYKTSDKHAVDGVKILNGANVLLIDDTLEAGATLIEAKRALEAHNTKSILAYIFLYGRDIKIAPAEPVR